MTDDKICKECGYPKWYQEKYESCDCCSYDSDDDYEYTIEQDHRLEEYDEW